MAKQSNFDQRKALHSLLYVVERLGDPANMYASLKALYFADKEHLSSYGRFIYGDNYFALKDGPVPSAAYDIIKYVAGRAKFDIHMPEAIEALSASDRNVTARTKADLDFFSQSDLICLEKGIEFVRGKTFNQIKKASHDSTYDSVANDNLNGEIPIEAFACSLSNKDEVLGHLKDRFPGTAN